MTSAWTCRVFVLAAGLLLGLGCEAVAPLQPLPNKDSGRDTATADKVGGEGGAEAGQLDTGPRLDVHDMSDAVPESDVATTADVAPDTSDGGAPDDASKTDGGDGDAADASDESDAASDDGGIVDSAQDSSAVGDAGGTTTDGGGADGPDVVICDPSQPFGDAIPVYGLNREPGREFRFRISPDELTVYVSAGDAWWATDLFVSQRASRGEPFGRLVPLMTLNTASMEGTVAVTADGLTAVFDSDRRGSGGRIYMAARPTPTEPFGVAAEVVIDDGSIEEYDPFVLPDGSTLYFSSNGKEGANGIYRVALSGMNAGPPTAVVLGSDKRFPLVTPDELRIYFTANDSVGSTWGDIWTMSRASREMPFGNPTSLSELNTDDIEIPQSLSPDGCRLYFTRTFAAAAGASYSFVAERVRRQVDAGVDGT